MNNNKIVKTYGSVTAENARIKKQLQKESLKLKWLTNERNVQNKVICQLKKMLSWNQTKSFCCTLGHYLCGINHQRYNYFNLKRQAYHYHCAPPKSNCTEKVIKASSSTGNFNLDRVSRKVEQL